MEILSSCDVSQMSIRNSFKPHGRKTLCNPFGSGFTGKITCLCTAVTSASVLTVCSVKSAGKGELWLLIFVKFCAQMGMLCWAGPSLGGPQITFLHSSRTTHILFALAKLQIYTAQTILTRTAVEEREERTYTRELHP